MGSVGFYLYSDVLCLFWEMAFLIIFILHMYCTYSNDKSTRKLVNRVRNSKRDKNLCFCVAGVGRVQLYSNKSFVTLE